MREVLRGSASRAPWVLFGHTHRAGPWPRDDRSEWTTPAGTRLINTGCWVYQPHFLAGAPSQSPYWPGTAIRVTDDGPPELVRLLGDRGHDELRPEAPPGVKQVAWQVTPSPISSSSTPRVWRSCSTSGYAPGPSTAIALPLARTSPRPSSTAQTPPGLVGPGVGAGLVGGLGRQQDAGRVLGAQRRHELALDAEQRLDLALGLVVGALAVVHRVERPAGVPQVARRPALVAVEVPQLEPLVDHDRVLDAEPRDGRDGGLGVARGLEAAGVDADHAQPVAGVALVPRRQVRQRAQRVDAAEVPELDEHRPAALLVHAQGRDVDPRELARERGRGDGLGRCAHAAGR